MGRFLLWCLLFWLAYYLVKALRIVWKIRRVIYDSKRQMDEMKEQQAYSGEGVHQAAGTSASSAQHKKVFAEDEGEYVDYEEVK